MKKISLPVVILVSSIFMNGCGSINYINDNTLNKDAQQLLQRYDVKVDSLSCQMDASNSRAGYCIYKATLDQNKNIVTRLKLDNLRLDKRPLEELELIKKGSCWNTSVFVKKSQVDVSAYWNRVSPQLYLSSGGRFDKFFLIYSQPEKTGCFQINYAYG
jgi:hypothetical protein